jgi:hypothetical protein
MYVRNVPDSIPISALNTLEYCPRRFYYQFVQSDMVINEFVLEGTFLKKGCRASLLSLTATSSTPGRAGGYRWTSAKNYGRRRGQL